jgi:hypothetical protein
MRQEGRCRLGPSSVRGQGTDDNGELLNGRPEMQEQRPNESAYTSTVQNSKKGYRLMGTG